MRLTECAHGRQPMLREQRVERTNVFFTRSTHALPYQMLHPAVNDGQRWRLYFVGIVCGSAGNGRRYQRRRTTVPTLWFYIIAVVLVQNVLMVYEFVRRANLRNSADTNETIVNLQISQTRDVIAADNSRSQRGIHVTSVPVSVKLAVESLSSNDDGQSDLLPSETTERGYYRKRVAKVTQYQHRILLAPKQLCDSNTVMVILVHSATSNIAQRAAIRETWGGAARTGNWPTDPQKGSCAGLRLAFVVGLHKDEAVNRALNQESTLHGDVIQGDFIDSYRNMTLKSLLDLKVVDENCPRVRYLLKTDDDMIVNLPYLLRLLKNKSLQWSIMGPVNVGARVRRSGKWKLTPKEFPFGIFPTYESGSAYVITGDLIHELFATAEYVPHIFIDDVYVTGILGRILGVNHVMHRGFAFWHSRAPSVCDVVLNRLISATKMDPKLLRDFWKKLRQSKCPVSF